MKYCKKNRAFTLVELLVAMALFVIFLGISTGSFIRVLRTQRLIVALIEANNNANLALEQIAREIRTGYNFSNLSQTELQFVNAENVTTFYRINDKAIERGTENVLGQRIYKKITADNIEVNNFRINLLGNNPGDGSQTRVTISLSVAVDYERIENVTVNVQTTISSRILDS